MTPEQFWARVDKNGPVVREDLGPCWMWTGALSKGGKRKPECRYGSAVIGGKNTVAHRHAWEMTHGALESRRVVVMHKCDNPQCVNPSHLQPGTQLENRRDAVAKERTHRAFWPRDAEHVLALRASGASLARIAVAFGTSRSSVGRFLATLAPAAPTERAA